MTIDNQISFSDADVNTLHINFFGCCLERFGVKPNRMNRDQRMEARSEYTCSVEMCK